MKLWMRAPVGAICFIVFVGVFWLAPPDHDPAFEAVGLGVQTMWLIGTVGAAVAAFFGFLAAMLAPLPKDEIEQEPSNG